MGKGRLKKLLKDAGTSVKNAAADIKKGDVKQIAKNLKAEAKRTGEKVGKIAGTVGKKALLMPLLPLKVAMITVLKLRKQPVKLTDSIDKVALLFYHAVVEGKNSFEYQMYENVNKYGLSVVAPQHLVEEVTSGIIKAILDWFKERKAKKDAGEKLPPEEEAALAKAEEGAKEAEEKAANANLTFWQRIIKFFTGKSPKQNYYGQRRKRKPLTKAQIIYLRNRKRKRRIK